MANIQQGKEYIKVNRIFTNSGKIHIKPLQLTTIPGLGSIYEAMNGDDSIHSANTVIKTNISSHEEEFNKTLVEYSNTYNTFSEDVLNGNNRNSQGNTNDKKANIDPILWNHLLSLNTKLIDLAGKINSDVNSLSVTDDNLKKQMEQQQSTLNTYIAKLKAEKNNMDKINNMDNVDGLQQNSELVMVSNKYHYLMWFILGLTIIAICIHIMSGGDAGNGIVLLVSLLALYFVLYRFN
jgi:hypothetical protein